ncbi:hypothetical protein CLV51_11321 [Chitinophaga niastensis]|uniref:Uncharacterized protein n=1 Tax=Chitinophaga niastensis TaxID=536980 RepID=A0A2P8H824_CHINA|nr:hypothetical protein [Chitinophaga niastensis]PSL42383.1 hypothetical protein CLV51_11321 [Chitinophaga niastensis]
MDLGYLDKEISSSDYREIKNRYEPEIQKLLSKKQELLKVSDNLMQYVMDATQVLRDLPQFYKNATLSVQQQIIGSIYLEKITFEENGYRTNKINEVVELICRPDGHLLEMKQDRLLELATCPTW